MPKSPTEIAKEHFSGYVLKVAAVATFSLAALIVGLDDNIGWLKINLFFFVSGALAFLVVVALNAGRNARQFAAMCVVLAFLPTFLVLMLAAVVLGVPTLVLLLLLRPLIGKKAFDNASGAIAGFLLKCFDWRKPYEKTVEANSLLDKRSCGSRVLSTDLCSQKSHEDCLGFVTADLKKYAVPASQAGDPIFCTCTCHKRLNRRLGGPSGSDVRVGEN